MIQCDLLIRKARSGKLLSVDAKRPARKNTILLVFTNRMDRICHCDGQVENKKKNFLDLFTHVIQRLHSLSNVRKNFLTVAKSLDPNPCVNGLIRFPQ